MTNNLETALGMFSEVLSGETPTARGQSDIVDSGATVTQKQEQKTCYHGEMVKYPK